MNLAELEKEAVAELEVEKKDMAKGLLKSRIMEIEKTERTLARLKSQYQKFLLKSVYLDIINEKINGRLAQVKP